MPKNIVLGVTGSIAAYKSAELIRALQKHDFNVKVIMTRSAQAFTSLLTLQSLSKHTVYAQSDLNDATAMEHIVLGRWADMVLIAPVSAHFIAKCAHGLADDLLSTLVLATQAPIILAPAMNTHMWQHHANKTNCNILKERSVTILEPSIGQQACGDYGPGCMMEPALIAKHIVTLRETGSAHQIKLEPSLKGLRVLVSAGPTQEPIDPIRYITNTSSGKMGYALAQVAHDQGCLVTLVSGPTQLSPPEGVTYYPVKTARDMLALIQRLFDQHHIFISAAAITDYRPAHHDHIEKFKEEDDTWRMTWIKNPDILMELNKKRRAKRVFTVGFAAETSQLIPRARSKLIHKKLNMIAANHIRTGSGFNCDQNALTVMWEDGEIELPMQSKTSLARELLRCIAERYRELEQKKHRKKFTKKTYI